MALRLREIYLKDFKSFKTARIPLVNGLTCICGPNGSGKSNIVDGILFVLGETRLRHLRARKLEDLVNHNSKTGVAVVSLKFDGDSEFTISRIINRKGKSIYKLNGKRRTRSEIVSFLRSVGIPVEGYNVVMQGEATKLLELPPTERRKIIEEVAGIVEYEEKKEEAERKLAEVEQRLREAEIILGERERILEELRKEKERAEEYLRLQELVKRAQKTIILAKRAELEKKRNELEEKRKSIVGRMRTVREELRVLEDRERSLQEKLLELEEKLTTAGLLEVKKEKALVEVEIRRCKQSLSSLESERQALEEEIRKIEKEIRELESQKKSFAALLISRREELQKLEDEMREALEKEAKLRAILEEESRIREEIARLSSELQRLEEKASEGEEIDILEKRRKDLEIRKKLLFEREKELNNKISELEEELVRLREKASGMKAILKHVGADVASELLSAQERGEISGIHGMLIDLIEYDKQFARAIEAAAGNKLLYLVAENEASAAEAIKYLKRKALGRATFIPLDKIKYPPRLDSSLLRLPGVVGRAVDLVRYDPKFEPAVRYALGGTLVVRDIDAARRIGVGRVRMVTLDGDLVELSGVMSGGMRKEITLKEIRDVQKAFSKIEEIRAEISSLKAELSRVRTEYENVREELAKIEERISLARKSIEEAKAVEEKKQKIVEQLRELEKRFSELEMEKTKLGAVKIDLEALQNIRSSVEELERKISELSGNILKLEGRKSEITSRISKIEEEKQNLENELKRLEKRARILSEQLAEAEKREKELRNELESIESELEQIRRRMGSLQHSLRGLEAEYYSIERELAILSVEEETITPEPEVEPLNVPPEEAEGVLSESLKKLEEIGPVNTLAIEEYERQRSLVEEAKEKVEKLKEEKEAVLRMIPDIESKKTAAFMEAFEKISENFSKIFQRMAGGEGRLKLTSEKLEEAGLLIEASPRGKKLKRLEEMSGGEKVLTALAFLFAVAMYRPAPFYIFDEPEIMLDKENTRYLAKMLKEFSKESQIIVITHSEAILREADLLIGVYLSKDGSSVIEVLQSGQERS